VGHAYLCHRQDGWVQGASIPLAALFILREKQSERRGPVHGAAHHAPALVALQGHGTVEGRI